MAYNLGTVKPWVSSAANELGPRFGIKSIGGYREGEGRYGHEDHPLGLALDLMTTSGDSLANYARENAQRLGVNYVIWNRKIWSPARDREGWRPYTLSNPHTDHVHISFVDRAPTGAASNGGGFRLPDIPVFGDLTSGVGAAANALRSMVSGVNAVGDLATKAMWLALPSTQVRIISGIAGTVLIAFGIVQLGRVVRNG